MLHRTHTRPGQRHLDSESSVLLPVVVCQGCGLGFPTESALRRHRNSGRMAHSHCRTDSSSASGSGQQDARFQDIPPVDDALEAMWSDDADAAGGSVPFEPAIQVKKCTHIKIKCTKEDKRNNIKHVEQLRTHIDVSIMSTIQKYTKH